jgi:molybdopterin-binding protein
VTDVRIEGLVAQVEVQAGSSHFVSLITADSARSLGLEVGAKVVVSIKATSVGVEVTA